VFLAVFDNLSGVQRTIFCNPRLFSRTNSHLPDSICRPDCDAYATSILTLTQPVLRTITPGPDTLISLTTPVPQMTGTAPAAMNETVLPCNRASAGKPSIDVTISRRRLIDTWRAFFKDPGEWSTAAHAPGPSIMPWFGFREIRSVQFAGKISWRT